MATQEDRDLEDEPTPGAGGRTPRGGDDGTRDPRPRDTIGRFTLLERIGMGGMGELHAAYDPRLDRKIALKLVRGGGGSQANARLLREAQALAKLSHPNVVTVFEVGIAPQRGVYVAMEYVLGKTLSQWLREAESRPERARVTGLLTLLREAGRGLDAVHRAGLAHRDFKPDNVIVGLDGRVRVIDFGLARRVIAALDDELEPPEPQADASAADPSPRPDADPALGSDADLDRLPPGFDSSVTRAGKVIGTPRYMAPEQWLAQVGDSRSDQFAFCVTLYHALYDQWPFAGEDDGKQDGWALMRAVQAGRIQTPPRKPEVSVRLEAAILRGLASDPTARAPDMGELLAAIDELLEPPRRRLSRVLLAALLAVLVLAAWSVLSDLEAQEQPLHRARAEVERELDTHRHYLRVGAEIEALVASGRHAEAEAVFETFATQRQHVDTDALARAWLDHARRRRARGELEGELAALGEAQVASRSLHQRRIALLRLVSALEQRGLHTQLASALAELDRIGAREHGEPGGELWSIGVREAITRRDFATASERLEQAPSHPFTARARPLLRELGRSTTSDHMLAPNGNLVGIVALPGFDLDGDGRDELLLLSSTGVARVLGSSPGLPLLQELELGPLQAPPLGFSVVVAARGAQASRTPTYVVVVQEGTHTVFELTGTEGRVEARPVLEHPWGAQWVTGDLLGGTDRAAVDLIAASSRDRRLVGWRRHGDGMDPVEVAPSLAFEKSIVSSLALGDLDDDGVEEMIVGSGAWWSYDVRVMRPGARLDLLARRKLGVVTGVQVVPAPGGRGQWIAVGVEETPPNPRVFPSSALSGAPEGVHILAWPGPGRALELVQHIGLPVHKIHSMNVGDLDGDGRSELLVEGQDSGLGILQLDADDRYAPLWIDELELEAVVDLDADGDDELLVISSAAHDPTPLLILGLGDAAIPTVDRRLPPPAVPPAALDPTLAELWRRGAALGNSGLYAQARATFEVLAGLAGPADAALALRRAAQVGDGHEPPELVARLFERAGDPKSLVRAVEIYDESFAYLDAARVAQRLADLHHADDGPGAEREHWTTRAAALRELGQPAATLEFDFSQYLDARWRLSRPELLQRESNGLRVECMQGAPLLERQIVWDGGALALELELELERVEWGSELVVELVALDEPDAPSREPTVRARLGPWGGGGYYVLKLDEGITLQPGAVGKQRPTQGALPPAGQRRFRLRMDLRAGSSVAGIRWRTLDGDGPRDTDLGGTSPRASPILPGRYVVRLRAGTEPWVRGTARLQRMRILGARDDPDARPMTLREEVVLALVREELDLALQRLDRASAADLDARDSAWLRALALDRSGDWPRAVTELERVFADCDDPATVERFAYALLLRADRLGPTLRRLCSPEQFLRATATITATTSFQHKDLLDIHRTLTTQVVELERFEPADFEMALMTMTLLSSRARGWTMQNLAEAAEADMVRVVELGERWWGRWTTEEQRLELMRNRSLGHVSVAAVWMHRGKPAAVAAELARALEVAEGASIIADVIAARSLFDPLRTTPAWAMIERAAQGLWQPRPGARAQP